MKYLSLTCLSVLLVAPSVWALDIVRNGEPQTAIVIPDEPVSTVEFAACELQYHIRKATGATLAIVRENQADETFKGLIYLGHCNATDRIRPADENLAVNGYAIRLVDQDLFLYGDDDTMTAESSYARIGTCSAVYELLETKMGVRWLWPGPLGEFVPQRRDLSIDAWNVQYRQRFNAWDAMTQLKENHSPSRGWSTGDMREQRRRETMVWLRRHRANKGDCIIAPHYFRNYWKRFGQTHPEFFARLPDGRRGPLEGDRTGHAVSMCVSQPAFWKQIVDDWKNPRIRPWFEIMYADRYLCCSVNDTPGLCMCESCRAWDAPDERFETSRYWSGKMAPKINDRSEIGSSKTGPALSDRYARYYLAVQAEAQKVNPDVIVTALGYWNYSAPPKQTRLNDRIQISLVPHFMYPVSEEREQRFRELWDGWHATGARLVFRPNFTGVGHNMPISYVRTLYDICTYAAERGMVGALFDSITGEWAVQGPSLYVMGRVMDRQDLPLETILDEYYAAFGPAGSAVRRYFDHWEDVSARLTAEQFEQFAEEARPDGYRGFKCWLPVADRIFTPEVMKMGRTLLEDAKTVEGLTEIEAARVDFLDKGLRHSELTLATLAAANRYRKTESAQDRVALARALKTLYAFRNRIDSLPVSNMGYLYYRERGLWEPSLASLPLDESQVQMLAEVWKFRFDPKENGTQNGWASVDLDDSDWDDIRVDACWEEQASGQAYKAANGQDYDGIAWYRTRFDVCPLQDDQRVMLLFGAVDETCEIYVNGRHVLRRIYDPKVNPNSWAEAFEVDVTDAVQPGRENTLAVEVEDRAYVGGIWKPVRLVYRNQPQEMRKE